MLIPNVIAAALLMAAAACIAVTSAPSAIAGPHEDVAVAHQRRDHAEAIRLLRPLADGGDANAQVQLGGMYRQGYGAPQDPAQAMTWYRRAAEQGNAVAQIALGSMYYRGDGAPQDHTQAAAWYRRAADRGRATAQAALGVMYANGQGVPRDRAEALRLLRSAAAAGNETARTELARVEAERRLEARNLQSSGQSQPLPDAAEASTVAPRAPAPEVGEPPSNPAPLAAEPAASAAGTPGPLHARAAPAAPVTDPSRLAAVAAERTAVPETTAPRPGVAAVERAPARPEEPTGGQVAVRAEGGPAGQDAASAERPSEHPSGAPVARPGPPPAPDGTGTPTTAGDRAPAPAAAAKAAALFAALMRHGEKAMGLGDVVGARSHYERAAALDPASSAAAIAAGGTYDRRVLALAGVTHPWLADAAKAAAWYERARALGDPAAVGLLARLR